MGNPEHELKSEQPHDHFVALVVDAIAEYTGNRPEDVFMPKYGTDEGSLARYLSALILREDSDLPVEVIRKELNYQHRSSLYGVFRRISQDLARHPDFRADLAEIREKVGSYRQRAASPRYDYDPSSLEPPPKPENPEPDRLVALIVDEVAGAMGIRPPRVLENRDRDDPTSSARQVSVLLVYECSDLSQSQVADIFGYQPESLNRVLRKGSQLLLRNRRFRAAAFDISQQLGIQRLWVACPECDYDLAGEIFSRDTLGN